MKKTVVATSLLCSMTLVTSIQAEEVEKPAQADAVVAEITAEQKNRALNSEIEQLKEEYSTAELLTALNAPKREKSGFHGTLGTNVEVERVIRDDGVNEGKVKYTLAQGSFRHDDLPGWDFGFYSGREELFNGNLKHAKYDKGVNAIQEIFVNRSYNHSKGNVGWGLKLAGESIDQRTTPGAKIFGSYQLNDRLSLNGYVLYHVEYKRGTGEFPYYEVEPGLGYKISDNSGAWVNFRYQVGEWNAKDGYKETETEYIIKPGIWYSWGKLSASLWGEFGSFEKERNSDGAHLWTEDYSKLGISANYPLSNSWRVFSEVSYKKMDLESGPERDKFDGYIPLFILGVNYSF
ncbi:OmpG porin family protein [Vibrio agarivorans]|uniref:OmpG porin family protein n=1 Tax=Vibrio agarivorans TaxID=153622 RepID=A0ABT7Y5N8_9VIBR|nr:OmpG porin family protein [Vibrio agarivorans]MDN2483370.1 OmpG porin family protein [Vibrio agarivorans]